MMVRARGLEGRIRGPETEEIGHERRTKHGRALRQRAASREPEGTNRNSVEEGTEEPMRDPANSQGRRPLDFGDCGPHNKPASTPSGLPLEGYPMTSTAEPSVGPGTNCVPTRWHRWDMQ